MELYLQVRLACADGMSQRAAAKRFNVSRDTVRKMLSFSSPPGYRRQSAPQRPKLDGFVGIIDGWLEGDRGVPRKQRHTAKRVPSLNKMLVLELARCEYILRRETIIALGNSGTGKTHVALALGLAACQKGFSVLFTTAAALVNQLMEARDEKRLLKMQRELATVKLLIVDELGYVPLSPTGAELLFETFSQRYERGSTIVTSNLPFEDWTQVLGSERLNGALLDRLTHHVSILAMNGDSYRLKQSARRRSVGAVQNQATLTD